MGRTPCHGKPKGPWSSEEDQLLINYIKQHGHANWTSLPKNAGLQRNGMSCRLRWTRHLAGETGRTPCFDKQGFKKGHWSSEEDELLINYINKHGLSESSSNWDSLAQNAGLQRNGMSCRVRWTNYLKPGINRGPLTPEEENLLIQLHTTLGNRWSEIASQLPGRTEIDIRNYWINNLKKELVTHEPTSKACGPNPPRSPSMYHMAQWESARLEAEARLSKESLIYDPHCSSSSYPDLNLRLWNSEVGDQSFQKVAKNENTEKSTCQGLVSQTSFSTKCASSSGLTQRDEDIEVKKDSKSHILDLNATPNSPGSDVVDDYSVSALQLPLDVLNHNDRSFLENISYDYLSF